ncbi:MAG: transposase [Chloroflexota bacterium]|nr:transposase [Chloroflexota bacterium]
MWSDQHTPARLHEQAHRKDDPDPLALACYGVWCLPQEQMLLRFVDGRPVSHVTTAFLSGVCEQLAAAGHKVWVLIWDNASWHMSAEVRTWIAAHNRYAKQTGQGIRILLAGLPTKSPWLNTIEPKWKHGKEAIVEAKRALTAVELEARVCACFETPQHPHLVQRRPEPEPAAAAPPPPTKKEPPERQQPVQPVKTQQAA